VAGIHRGPAIVAQHEDAAPGNRQRPEPGIDRSAIDGTYFGPLPVPRGGVFVLGDNREASVDSRHYGPVPVDQIRGRVLFLWDGPG